MNTADVPQPLMTPAQVAELLAVSTRTLWRMIERGQLPPPVRFTRKMVRWHRADIIDFLAGLKGGRQ